MTGTLYVVATPIGNLKDLSYRAVEILKQVDVIAAEDTRHSRHLLDHYAIGTVMTSFHEHTKEEKKDFLIQQLEEGRSMALVSDAGTPLISDPGHQLVAKARQHNIPVVPVPGPCAAVTALSVAGLATDRFLFEGFLPAKPQSRRNRLQALEEVTATIIFYEAPHRIIAMVEDLVKVFGEDRQVAIAKELTKTFETVFSATPAAVLEWLQADSNHARGEFVVLVSGKEEKTEPDVEEALRIYSLLKEEMSTKQAVKMTVAITGFSKNKLYQLVVS
jgi:16S rRNA (cytidine1402-2'-O)-methyltransferase